jgi:hypothetical protein
MPVLIRRQYFDWSDILRYCCRYELGSSGEQLFQLDEARPYFPGTVTAHLYGIFSMRLIKTGEPLKLPARSADLMPCDL